MTYVVHASATTMTGRRKRNEDAYCLDPDLGIFVVLDGMGGYAGGMIASSLAAETITDFYHGLADDPEGTWPYALDGAKSRASNRVDAAIRLANRRIRERRQGSPGDEHAVDLNAHSAISNMGATVAMLSLGAHGAVLGHLGDSRIYRLRGRDRQTSKIAQLTCDHSLYEELRKGGVDVPPLRDFVHNNIITRALGPVEDERPELGHVDLRPGDRFLLCTDGLTGSLEAEQIAEILVKEPLQRVSTALVEAAFAAGSRDNITALVVDVERSSGPS